jgi:hypothetical protein
VPDNERYELICGTFYSMSPMPPRFHQEISMTLPLTLLPELIVELDLLFRGINTSEQTLFAIKKSG